MKGRNSDNKYSDDLQSRVEAASREKREVASGARDLRAIGHHRSNPVKAIRDFCLDCLGGSAMEVRLCTSAGCALYPFRLGKNPFRKPGKAPVHGFKKKVESDA